MTTAAASVQRTHRTAVRFFWGLFTADTASGAPANKRSVILNGSKLRLRWAVRLSRAYFHSQARPSLSRSCDGQ